MPTSAQLLQTVPVLPSSDIQRDLQWHEEKTGFIRYYGDDRYACLRRENLEVHLQWHADTEDDPLLGGSVLKIFVSHIETFFREFVERGTVTSDKLRRNTPWGTHEFGFYDLNNNAIFLVEDI